jgi:hypothetical protein
METQVFIRINEHKMPEYPSYGHVVMFDGDFDKFKSKVDEIITSLNIQKANVYIDNPEDLCDEEIESLEARGFII